LIDEGKDERIEGRAGPVQLSPPSGAHTSCRGPTAAGRADVRKPLPGKEGAYQCLRAVFSH
jgi:hypothetical protein